MTDGVNDTKPMGSSAGRDAFIRRSLVTRLLADQTVAELANIPLGALAIALTWGSVALRWQLAWFALLGVATAIRMVVRKSVQAEELSEGIPNRLRAAIVSVAAVWGAGVLTLAPHVPHEEIALILVIVCGLTAAATSTLLADPKTYIAYNVAMLGATALAALRLADSGTFRVATVIVVLYGGVMASLYTRLRAVLMQSLNNEFEIGLSRGAAEQERAFLDRLIDSAPTAIVVVDDAGQLVRANPSFERVFGYTRADAAGRPLGELILPPSEVDESNAWRSRVSEGRTVDFEARRLRKDGEIIDVRVTATKLEGEHGGTLGMYDDITKRKAAERELRDSEARLFRTLASLPLGITVMDLRGRRVLANEAARHLLGPGITSESAAEQAAGTYDFFVAGTDRPYPLHQRPIYRALRGESSSIDDIEVHTPDGTKVLEVFGSPIRDANGDVMLGVAAFTDITERRRTSEALERARVEAEEATAAKSAFLANMSHEIRTPLNGILGMAELVLDGELAAEDRKSVQLIMQSGETLLRVINDILDFSKIEAGQLEIESTELEPELLVDATVHMLMPRAVAQGIEIVADVRSDVPALVLGDPTRIRQVLTNLIGNAVKFTQQGEVAVLVERIDGDGDAAIACVRFSVRDTGVGIPADKLTTIFDAFRQADATTTRRYGGTGLGLSISRRLVELMGGTLTVESTAGVGSTFSFSIAMPVVEGVAARPAALARLDGLRVLIVDDNATNRRIMHGVLAAAKCEVSEAANGFEGLVALREAVKEERPFAVLVTDLMMPDMDGFSLVRELRNDSAMRELQVVLAASISRRGDSALARELGIGAQVLKPVSRMDLLQAVKSVAFATPAKGVRVVPAVSGDSHIAAQRVLLAEDNIVNQEVASAVLRRRGHHVDIVGTGREAVEAVKQARYDIVLMDLQMPEMDGLEATSLIRQDASQEGLRIVALTANAMTGERERCIAAGMDDYLAKPFKAADLIAIVENRERAGSATPGTSTTAVDLHGLRRDLEAGGVAHLLDDLVKMFLADSGSRMAAIRAAVVSGDGTAIERAAHAFKSPAATIHAERLAALLGELEKHGRANDLGDSPRLMAEIDDAYAAAEKELTP